MSALSTELNKEIENGMDIYTAKRLGWQKKLFLLSRPLQKAYSNRVNGQGNPLDSRTTCIV